MSNESLSFSQSLRAFLMERCTPWLGGWFWMEEHQNDWYDKNQVLYGDDIDATLLGFDVALALLKRQDVSMDKDKPCAAFSELPLFPSHEWVRAWVAGEHERGFGGLSEEYKTLYAARLATDGCREAARPGHQVNKAVVKKWMEVAGKDAIRDLLQHSRDVVAQLKQRYVVGPGTLETNCVALGRRLEMTDTQIDLMRKFSHWVGLCWYVEEVLFNPLVQIKNQEEMWEVLADVWGVSYKEVMGFVGNNGPLRRVGFLHPEKKRESHAITSARDFNNLVINENLFRPLSGEYEDGITGLIRQYVTEMPPVEGAIALRDYPHLNQEIAPVVAGLSGTHPVRVLLWGPPGTGKTSLVQALMRHVNAVPAVAKLDVITSTTVDKEMARLEQLQVTRTLGPLLADKIVMVVDECESLLTGSNKKTDLNAFLDVRCLPEVWVANDLDGIHAACLRRFDLIVRVGAMPLAHREAMAKTLFPDANIALRVAQACQSPASIRLAHRWWSLDPHPSWATIAQQLAQAQQAKQAAQSSQGAVWTPDVVTPTPGAPGLSDVAGFEAIKQTARGLTKILAEPERFQSMRAQVPKGILLAGAPGTGKTHLARALAQELSVPLLKAAASDLAEVPERLGVLFAEARRMAPCLVFLDEIDVLGSSPMGPMGTVDTRKQVILNRLLVELDGFDALEGVLVIGATHRLGVLDGALTRSGRFSQPLVMEQPSAADRAALWTHYINRHPHQGPDVDALAHVSGGMSPADIAQAVNRAAIQAVLNGADHLTAPVLREALDTVYWGDPSTGAPLSEEARWRTAVHESGHILMAWKNNRSITRATVRPRQTFLGAVQIHQDDSWAGFANTEEVQALVQVDLGGLLAERLVLGDSHSQGVSQDLQNAHALARKRLTAWGMGDTLAHRAIGSMEPLSDGLLTRLEDEERRWMDQVEQNATQWLAARKSLLEHLAKTLLERREMSCEELRAWKAEHMDNVVPLASSLPGRADGMAPGAVAAHSGTAVLSAPSPTDMPLPSPAPMSPS